MKYLILFGFLFIFFTSKGQEVKGPNIKFEESTYEFGDITQGSKVEKTFKYTNTGTEPLIISDVVTTCGCTATKWSKEPLLPGQTRDILATFNSTGKEGRQNKVITIISNATNNPSRITLISNVIPVK